MRAAASRSGVGAVLAASILAGACVGSFGAPPGPPTGTYTERLSVFAKLLVDEDRKWLDPLRAGRAASSPDPWVRAKTGLALGRIGDREGSLFLTVLLGDPDPKVRAAAAFGAGLLGDPRLTRFLAGLLPDPDPDVAALAAEALGKLGTEDATRALLDALRTDSAARPAASRALFRAPTAASVAALLPLAAVRDERLRHEVLYALARKPRPEAAPALRQALDDADVQTVATAARGLGVLGDDAAAPKLATLAGRVEISIAVQALAALEKIGAKSPLPPEARAVALKRSSDVRPGVAVAAIRLLGRFPGAADAGLRLGELVDGDGWRGQTALASLGSQDPAAAAKRIGALAATSSPYLRLGAVDAAGALPEEASLAAVGKLLGDPSARVRSGAIGALAAETLARHPDVAVRALRDADPAVRAAGLEASAPDLAKDGWAEAARAWDEAFRRSFSEDASDFTVTALDAAAARTTGGKELLVPKSSAADPVVRARARKLLAEKFGVPPPNEAPRPVAPRLSEADATRLAREANELTQVARVETSRGTFEIALALEDAPRTVWNFSQLARKRFFDGIVIHRVVPDFVVQAGDPRGDGNGGPGWAIRDEINPRRYGRGAVGMALSGPDTGGSQWFVALAPQPHLDGGYTVFGRVDAPGGMDLLDRTEQDDRLVRVTIVDGKRSPSPGFTRP